MQCQTIHGDRYDYSETVYDGDKKPVTIICKIHGSFVQRNDHHKNGHGCIKCMGDSTRDRQRSDTASFTSKAEKIYGNNYEYSKVDYVNAREKVNIICKFHGDFWITPDNHLHGTGCALCANETRNKNNTNSVDKVISICNLIHDNKYNYSKMIYKNSKLKVEIICPNHGSFFQNMCNHMYSKKGCQACNTYSKGEEIIYQILTLKG